MTSFGMKAQVKKTLKEHGIKQVRNNSGVFVKLANAKISDLIKAEAKLAK